MSSSRLATANSFIRFVIKNHIQPLEEGRELFFQIVHPETETSEGFFEFRIDSSIIRPEYQDLTVLVRDYKYMRTDLPYSVRYSIYSRLFRLRENRALNPKAPEVEITVYEILPKDHPEFLSSDHMGEIEETIILETCQFWKSLVIT